MVRSINELRRQLKEYVKIYTQSKPDSDCYYLETNLYGHVRECCELKFSSLFDNHIKNIMELAFQANFENIMLLIMEEIFWKGCKNLFLKFLKKYYIDFQFNQNENNVYYILQIFAQGRTIQNAKARKNIACTFKPTLQLLDQYLHTDLIIADLHNGRCFLHTMASFPYTKSSFVLLSNKIKLSKYLNVKDGSGRTPFFYAARYSDKTTVAFLSQYNPQIQNEILYHMVESFGVLPHNPFSASLMNPRFDVSVYLASYMNTLFPGSKEIWMSNNSLQAAILKLLNYKNNFRFKDILKRLKLIQKYINQPEDFVNIILCSNINHTLYISYSLHRDKIVEWLCEQNVIFTDNNIAMLLEYYYTHYGENIYAIDSLKLQINKMIQKRTDPTPIDFWSILKNGCKNWYCSQLARDFAAEFCQSNPMPTQILADFMYYLISNGYDIQYSNGSCICCQNTFEICVKSQLDFMKKYIGLEWINVINSDLKLDFYLSTTNSKVYQHILGASLIFNRHSLANIFLHYGINPDKINKDYFHKCVDHSLFDIKKAIKYFNIIKQQTILNNLMKSEIECSPPSPLLKKGGKTFQKVEENFQKMQ